MKRIGVILADTNEYKPFVEYFSNEKTENVTVGGNEGQRFELDGDKNVIAVHCGIGKVNAANAAAALIYCFGVDAIISAGLSGAVSGVKREDVVAGTHYVECDFDLTALGMPLGVKPDEDGNVYEADGRLLEIAMNYPKMKSGKLGTGDVFLTDPVRKKLYSETFGISAFDMETGAIACVCKKNDTAFLSVRKISDDADDESKDTYREMNDRCEADLSEIVRYIVERI